MPPRGAGEDGTKRVLDLQVIPEEDKRSPEHKKSKHQKKEEKKEERRREKKEKKAEKKAKSERREEEAAHWRTQLANTPHRPQIDPTEATISPPRRDTLRSYSNARSSTSRNNEAMPSSEIERLNTAEEDINRLYQDTSVLFSGMKQVQKQQNYLMQRDQIQARKEASMQALVTGWPPEAQESDRDRVIDWMIGTAYIPTREFLYASHKVQEDSLSRISILHFRSVWATKKFLDVCRKMASDRNPLPYWHTDNNIPHDSTGKPYTLRVRQQISTPDRIKSIPMKAFLQLINDTPDCEYHRDTRNLYKNWAANVIATESGNLLKCVFNDAEGTVKLLIREDLFRMVEDGLASAWKKVTTRNADEQFATQKGKGKGKHKALTNTSRGIQDYLYDVHIVKVRPHEEEDENL